ncbi:MAG: hypothetical protein HZA90_13435 [Verrucomicrobia bacterium]|nr:hypothetical protein [Verrucomicrobiota bacterium]
MPWLRLTALVVSAFTLATVLEPALRQWSRRKAQAQGVLAALMGDSRRLFANHLFVQSDVYLHGGYYPSIFDQSERPPDAATKPAAARQAAPRDDDHKRKDGEHDEHSEACDHDFLGRPRNWIDAFGRNFFPSQHTHLGEGKAGMAEAREILPWLKLSAELDPQRVETYVVAAYWLRQMNKETEALQFLREGLRHNPDSYDILFELGLCYENKNESALARNLWEISLRRWQEQQSRRERPDHLMLAQLLTHLARLEVRAHRPDVAVKYLETLKTISPHPEEIQKRIEEVKAGQPFEVEKKP